jgi:hypothetical protein
MINKRVLYGLALFTLLLGSGLHAQATTLSTGTVKNVSLYNGTGVCPTTLPGPFLDPSKVVPGATITCRQATITCPNVTDMDITWGVVNLPGFPKGTIVLHNGSGGTQSFNGTYATSFTLAGFQVVQVAWRNAWEVAGTGHTPSIKNAACRPATFFKYIHDTYAAHGNSTQNPIPMCLLGWSAGSAAIAYSLAQYGAGSYVDKAMMLAGPPLSDIETGCEVPYPGGVRPWPSGQFGMAYTSTFVDDPQYSNGNYQSLLRDWTGNATCDGATTTSSTSDVNWGKMSIVDSDAGTTDATFSYPQTAVSAWIPGPDSNGGHPTDISAQSELYFQVFTNASQFAGHCGSATKPHIMANGSYSYTGACYADNEVDGEPGREDVWNGNSVNGVTTSPFHAMINDMTDPVVGCIKRH